LSTDAVVGSRFEVRWRSTHTFPFADTPLGSAGEATLAKLATSLLSAFEPFDRDGVLAFAGYGARRADNPELPLCRLGTSRDPSTVHNLMCAEQTALCPATLVTCLHLRRTMGLFSVVAPVDPWNTLPPKAKIPPSLATSQ
jgi:hypothetical protein